MDSVARIMQFIISKWVEDIVAQQYTGCFSRKRPQTMVCKILHY